LVLVIKFPIYYWTTEKWNTRCI